MKLDTACINTRHAVFSGPIIRINRIIAAGIANHIVMSLDYCI